VELAIPVVCPMCPAAKPLAEGERVDLGTRIEEGDLEGAVSYGAGLADELVQPLSGHRAVALVADVGAVRRARRLSVDAYVESYEVPGAAGPMTR
jgi:hypothetical protein